jgi:uncharacterized membrane protein
VNDLRRHSWDLLAVNALALVALAAGALSRGPNPALTALTVPLVLILPGYALVATLIPYGHFGFPERLALSVGVSMALAALGGLLLHALSIPLDGPTWRVALALITLAAAAVGLARRRQGRLPPVPPLAAQMSPREALLLSTGALLIGLALGLGGIGTATPPGESFTGFWALGSETGDRTIIRIGLNNEEGRPVTYNILAQAGDRLVAEWPEVTVPARGEWNAEATVPLGLIGQELDALAYRTDDVSGRPYRRARITVERSSAP